VQRVMVERGRPRQPRPSFTEGLQLHPSTGGEGGGGGEEESSCALLPVLTDHVLKTTC
jgi:hypothetical protein